MLQSSLMQDVDKLWNKFWANGLTNPIKVIEQMTYLIFIKKLEEYDDKHDGESIFKSKTDPLRWSIWKNYDNDRILQHVKNNVFPFIKDIAKHQCYFSLYMENTILEIEHPTLLSEAVEIIDNLKIDEINHDVQGDIYEHILKYLSTTGLNGQFRTPRHIINLMVQILKPKLNETVCDPACGTGGFLVNAFEYIEDHNKLLNLNKKEMNFLKTKQFFGYDFETSMVRIAGMNMILHGFNKPNVCNRSTLSEDFDHENKFKIILANPPFSGIIDKSHINKRFSIITTKTELLYLQLIVDILEDDGRAIIIVPEGALFVNSKAHVEIRKMLIENCCLDVVISLPSGVFKPYAGVATSILFFTKKGKTNKIQFYKMENDGYSLDDKRKKIKSNDIPSILGAITGEGVYEHSLNVSYNDIVSNKYNLSFKAYQKYVPINKNLDSPEIILNNMDSLRNSINDLTDELLNVMDIAPFSQIQQN